MLCCAPVAVDARRVPIVTRLLNEIHRLQLADSESELPAFIDVVPRSVDWPIEYCII